LLNQFPHCGVVGGIAPTFALGIDCVLDSAIAFIWLAFIAAAFCLMSCQKQNLVVEEVQHRPIFTAAKALNLNSANFSGTIRWNIQVKYRYIHWQHVKF